jgi:hypothetical protein
MAFLFNWFERQAAANDPPVSPLALPAPEVPKNTSQSPYFSSGVPGPPLLTNEPIALDKQRGNEQKRLHGYGWVDEKSGVAYMPIEEAKKLILQRGLPAREGEPVPPTLGTHLPAQGESSGGRVITGTVPEPPAAPGAQPAQEPGLQPHGEPPAAKPHRGGH